MANILGEPFADWVQLQIAQRQKRLGQFSGINNNDLQYYYSKNSWIKLASSVDIEDGKRAQKDLANLGFTLPSYNFTGDKLAKSFVLFGGASDYSGSLNSGIGSRLNSAYGWGGTEERGYVPMPGIEQANVTYQNNGALAKVNISIKCHSRKQLALIDYLYLRPGYTLLLEFGWSIYYDNNINNPTLIKSNIWSTKPFETLFDGNKNQYDMYSSIKTEKELRYGNYEALFGKITNFKWTLNKDGSYSCNVTLTTLGDVIESLKLNVASNNATQVELKKDEPAVKTLRNLSALNAELYNIYEKAPDDGWADYTHSIPLPVPGNNTVVENITFKNAIWVSKGVLIEDDWFNTHTNQIWIKFGVLCGILQSSYLLYNNNNLPLIHFDIDYKNLDEDKNYMLTFPGQISGDPTICLISLTDPLPEFTQQTGINYDEVIRNPNTKSQITPEWDKFKFNIPGESFQGRLSNVLVNINYLSKLLYELPKDEENNINILSFLKEVLNGISSALGGINNFSIETSIEDGLIRIFDKSPQIQDSKNNSKTYSTFNAFGVRNNEGSFIRNIDMTSELSSNFASMVSIGAQSNGNQVQGNATSFSEFNAGLRDRIIPEKISIPPINSNTSTQNGGGTSTVDAGSVATFIGGAIVGGITRALIAAFSTTGDNDAFIKVYHDKQFLPEYIEALKNTLSEYNKLFLGYYFSIKKTTVPFFIPFNMSLEMDGLAGMVLYQKFKVYENVLPLSYGTGNLDYIIKGINHTITPHDWVTKIETQTTPIPK